MRLYALAILTLTAASFAQATKIVNATGHALTAKRVQQDSHAGYKITIDGKPTLHEHYVATMMGASTDVLFEIARSSPVIFGRPAFVRFSISQRCPGSRKAEIIEALVQSKDEEYLLCFALRHEISNGTFFVATEMRD